LRTPLNAIYGFAQILEKDPSIPEHRQGSVTTIRRSSEHLAGLIEGLLDISRIEAGRLEIMRDRINLKMFIKQITAIFEEEARSRGIKFKVRTKGIFPTWVAFDEKRLRQILINLLSNALRYTKEGEVKLLVAYRNEVAQIEVSDTGVGIAPEFLPRIWKPFERASETGAKGSGLGLTITKLLVEILGGEIEVESTPGVGSTFRTRLMLPSLAADSVQPNEIAQDARTLPVSGYRGSRKTVMVVDDDLNHLSLVSHMLEPLGFAVVVADSAELAQEMLTDITPDLFVLDIDMPGQDGWSLAKHLRNSDMSSVPIIIVSGHANDETAPTRDFSLHDAFVAKPYNVDDLIVRIADLLKIELELASNTSTLEPDESPQDKAAIAKLIEAAKDGNVAEVRGQMELLVGSQSIPDDVIKILEAKLSGFDLPGLAHVLEETCYDQA